MAKKKVYKYDEGTRAKILSEVESGKPVQKVADEYKIAPSAVYGWMKAAGMTKPGRPTKGLNVMGKKVVTADNLVIKIAAAYLANAIKHWDTERSRPLVQLALIELKEAL